MNKLGVVKSNINRRKIKDKKQLYHYYWTLRFSTRKIAEILTINHATVSRTLRRLNIKTRKLKKNLVQKKIIYLYNKNFSLSFIAKKFKSTPTRIKKILIFHKINIRRQSFYTRNSKNPNWHGGVSLLPYSFDFNNELKEQICKRDKYKCQLCHKSQNRELKELNRKLSIHHIDYNKQNCKENNLITLCNRCNLDVNHNRDYWFAYFTYTIKEKENYLRR